MSKSTFLNFLKTIFKIAVTVGALYFVFSKIDFNTFFKAIKHTNLYYIVAAVTIFIISQILSADRLHLFFKSIGLEITRPFNYKLYSLGLFYNLFLPGGIGGDGYKILLLRKKFSLSGKKLFWAIFLDRLSGLWALFFILAFLLAFSLPIPHIALYSIGLFLVGSCIYYIAYQRFFTAYVNAYWQAHLRAIGIQVLHVICASLVLLAIGYRGNFVPYMAMFLISALAAVIPISIGGLGTRELAFIYGATYFKLDQELAVMMSLLYYCTCAVVSLAGVYFVFKNKEFKTIESTVREPEM